MKNKKITLTIIGIFLISFVSAGVSYCCEKTKVQSDGSGGAWCINAEAEKCDTGNNCGIDKDGSPMKCRKVPTSCEATSYCKLGCCFNSKTGVCMENTPQKLCEQPGDGIQGGVWEDSAQCDIPQCSLGCCLIGAQAAFVTQTRCKSLSADYGLETNFRTDISSELICIASATSDVKGACVFEREYEKTCTFLTQKECKEIDDSVFHKGFLCSADQLATNCGPTEKTRCVEGRDEVFFVDSCGNLANIYDSNPPADYWTKIYGKADSCGYGNSNANSKTCGNCDYYEGSTCKKAERGNSPRQGDYICEDLSCNYEGVEYQHGETWCAESKGVDESLPGSRHFRLVCYNGEVTVEPCADFRQEICVQSTVNNFKTAACRVNKWEDCVSQENKKDCENEDRRDCKWINSGNKDEEDKSVYVCVPKYAPGFTFWESESGEDLCGLASRTCTITRK